MSKVWQVPPPPKVAIQSPDATYRTEVDEGVSISASGLGAMGANLLALAQGARDAAQYEMSVMLSEILTDSQDNYVPIDTGALREAGDHDTYAPESRAQSPKEIVADTMRMAVWYAGGIALSPSTVGELSGRGEVHAGHRLGSRVRRNIRTYGPEHLGFHLQGPQFKEWAHRNPVIYARDQHENMSYRHGLNWSGTGPGQAKYLERPFNKAVDQFVPRVSQAVAAAWRGTPGTFTGD